MQYLIKYMCVSILLMIAVISSAAGTEPRRNPVLVGLDCVSVEIDQSGIASVSPRGILLPDRRIQLLMEEVTLKLGWMHIRVVPYGSLTSVDSCAHIRFFIDAPLVGDDGAPIPTYVSVRMSVWQKVILARDTSQSEVLPTWERERIESIDYDEYYEYIMLVAATEQATMTAFKYLMDEFIEDYMNSNK